MAHCPGFWDQLKPENVKSLPRIPRKSCIAAFSGMLSTKIVLVRALTVTAINIDKRKQSQSVFGHCVRFLVIGVSNNSFRRIRVR